MSVTTPPRPPRAAPKRPPETAQDAEALRCEYEQRTESERPLPRSVARAFQELLAQADRQKQ